jgi:hypothetical protein
VYHGYGGKVSLVWFEAFPSWWRDESDLLMIDSYFDESGRAGRHLTVVSAYVGSTRDMSTLSKGWQRDLAEMQVEYFHAKDFDNKDAGVFRHLSASQRKRLLDRLLNKLKRRIVCGITAHVDDGLYEDITTSRFRSQWGAPYSFCVHTILGQLDLFLEECGRSRERINVVLEHGHRNVCQVIEQLHRPGGNFGNIGTAAKRDQPVLQAADLSAYSTCDDLCTDGRSYLFERLRATKKPTYRIACTREYIEGFRLLVGDYFQMRSEVRRMLKSAPNQGR